VAKTSEVFHLDPDEGVLTLKLRRGLYPMDVIYGAAYVLIDRAYVVLDKDAGNNVLVHVRCKQGRRDERDLHKLAGDFANEALSQALRARINREHKSRMEAVVSQAVAGSLGIGGGGDELSLDALDAGDDDLDFLDDPLGIAVPWEEKFKKSANKERPDTRRDEDAEPGPGDSGGYRPVKPEGPQS